MVDADKKVAIDRYVGYRHGEPMGTQLDNAERKAKTALRPGGALKAKVSNTVKGYVAGLPSGDERRKADLAGRLVMAQTAMIENMKGKLTQAQKDTLTIGYNEAEVAAKYAGIEGARVQKIQEELSAIG